MTYTIQLFGTRPVLVGEDKRKLKFRDVQALCDHIKKTGRTDITNLEILPMFYRNYLAT